MPNMISINGLTIETDKLGMSCNGDVIVFSDGSTYNTRTRAFNNAGYGYVKVNGKLLHNTEGDSSSAQAREQQTKSYDFATTSSLQLKLVSASVVVERHDKLGMHVEVSGPADVVESLDVCDFGKTLLVKEDRSSLSSSNSVVVSSYGSNVHIGSYRLSAGDAVTIKIYVPLGTDIDVLSTVGDVNVYDVDGPLSVSIQGSADVSASSVNGRLRVNIAGSGDVCVDQGIVDTLDVSIAGSGDVRFGGTAQRASLAVAGTGEVTVSRIIEEPLQSVAGSGDIRIGQVG